MASTRAFESALSKAGKEVFEDFKRVSRSYQAKLRPKFEETAKLVAKHEKLIGDLLVSRLLGKLRARDVSMAVKNYRQSVKSAIKNLEDEAVWEADAAFWTVVSDVTKIVSSLVSFFI